MAVREEIVKQLAAVFAVIERYDHGVFPYRDTVSLWEDHLQAANAIEEGLVTTKFEIVLRHLQLLNTGRVVWHDVKVVWRDGKWISDEHDPRAKDPQYREYLRLKEIYDE